MAEVQITARRLYSDELKYHCCKVEFMTVNRRKMVQQRYVSKAVQLNNIKKKLLNSVNDEDLIRNF